ncbi:MAG: hypothetical protein HYY97_12915 [Rhodocyclales bacterium]|nr:hypothetical protein [Rhodocyclales bacterium]
MHGLLGLAGALLALPALAQFLAHSAAGPCARARDPLRCEAREAALNTCAAKRGAEKSICLEAAMPPPDCRRAPDPRGCAAGQKAAEICRGKTGKQLRQCLREQQPPQKARKPAAAAAA